MNKFISSISYFDILMIFIFLHGDNINYINNGGITSSFFYNNNSKMFIRKLYFQLFIQKNYIIQLYNHNYNFPTYKQ